MRRLAYRLIRKVTHLLRGRVFDDRTFHLMSMDLERFRARAGRDSSPPPSTRLHFGCGGRRVPGWLNVDVAGSEQDVDLAGGVLPWPDACFDACVGQHVIEHLELETQLLPLLEELSRVSRPGGELWVSCPDLDKVCRGYVHDRASALLSDRITRYPRSGLPEGFPSQHFVNVLFHQGGQHRNLFDFELLEWTLERAGFRDCTRVTEADFLERFPEFPPRHDDLQTLFVRAVAPGDARDDV